jgi:hypothetical protein
MLTVPEIGNQDEQSSGQATFEMANLRPEQTGLPFVVFISQKDGARHDIRVKVSRGPKVLPHQMGTYARRPFRFEGGYQLSSAEEKQLEAWISQNQKVLEEYWDGDILYTSDAIERLVRI